MSRSAALWLLGLLFTAIAAVELRLTWSTLVFAADPESVHYRLPLSDRLVKSGEPFGGLQPGDRVVAIDGIPVASRWETQQQVIRRPVGAPVRATVERAGQRLDVEVPTRSWPMTVPGRVSMVVQNVITTWFCISLGFLIALRRPQDRMAWLVLFILLGLAQIHVYLFITDEWNAYLAGLMRLLTPFLRYWGVVAWLWFGLDFGAGPRLLPWLRWPLSLALLYHAAQLAVESLVRLHFPDWLPQLTAAGLPVWLAASLTLAGLLLGFANLLHRLRGDVGPDTQRRLRLLVAGMLAGRGPIMVLELAGLFGLPESSFPLLYLAFAISAIFLVPVTFAYVLIVDRAMDLGVVVRQGLQYAFARRGVDALRGLLALLPLVLVENRWWAIGGSLSAVMLAGPIAERLRVWIDRRFFREAVQAERVLADIAGPLRSITDPEEVLRVVAGRVSAALHVTEIRSWLAPGAPPAAADWDETLTTADRRFARAARRVSLGCKAESGALHAQRKATVGGGRAADGAGHGKRRVDTGGRGGGSQARTDPAGTGDRQRRAGEATAKARAGDCGSRRGRGVPARAIHRGRFV
ncbi:MAG: PDZ domain-containing protein [Bryobacterales bacterium]|nr:PDZ domain-containing protein [Bryobacterales bacterium]